MVSIMNTLLLTGAASKLAIPIIRQIGYQFSKIYLLTKNSDLDLSGKRFKFIKLDLSKSSNIPIKTNLIIHLAAVVPYNNKSRVAVVLEENSKAFLNVMKFATKQRAKVVFISSTDVYPLLVKDYITETTVPLPHNEYGLSKLICERIGEAISEIFDIPLTILRLGPIYSEYDSTANRISNLLHNIKNGKTIKLNEQKNILSLIHLENAAEAIGAAAVSMPGKYNIAGIPLSIQDFVNYAINQYCSKSKVESINSDTQSICLRFDLNHAMECLNWKPFSLDEMFNR